MKRVIVFVFLLLLTVTASFAATTPEDIARAVKPESLQHPYLYFTADDVADLRQRIETDPTAADIMAKLLAEANRLMYTPVETELPPEAKHPRYWSDNKHNNYVSSHQRAAQTLAFVYQMTGDEKYAQKAFEFTDPLCDMHLWMYRAHEFPIIYSRVWPWNVADDQVVFSYDIRSGHMGYEIAAVYDWLYPALNKRQRDRIRGALLENVILLCRGNYDYHWWANAYRCNWCGICFSGLGAASLALLTENPELVDVVAESYNRMSRMFDEFGVDGGWQEGRSYWAYGMNSCMYFMEALRYTTNGKYNLYLHPRIKANPADFALYGLTGYFGDGSGAIVGTPYFLTRLVEETGDDEAAWYLQNFLGDGSTMWDILWPKTDRQGKEPRVKSKHFRTIDWAFMRSGFKDPESVTIACKAGLNDDPHHGHLDIGQFMVTWRDQYFITDLGSGKYFYDEKYFDEIRWDYPQASSKGHNVVFVNGEEQICAKYKDQPWQDGIGGKILDFRTSDARDYVLMDPTNAYPGKELKGWRRHIVLDKPVVTVVLDEVSSARGAEIEARFHSEAGQEAHDNFMLLKGKKGTMAVIPVMENAFTLREGKHPYLPVRKDAKFQWIPYFGIVTKAKSDNTRIVSVIVPVEDADEAAEIARSASTSDSGETTLTFRYRGKEMAYRFDGEDEGLVLAR